MTAKKWPPGRCLGSFHPLLDGERARSLMRVGFHVIFHFNTALGSRGPALRTTREEPGVSASPRSSRREDEPGRRKGKVPTEWCRSDWNSRRLGELVRVLRSPLIF